MSVGLARVRRIVVPLSIALGALLAVLALTGGKAEAQSLRISCDVYATNQVDPIGHATHDHRQFGNTGTTNTSTWSSLRANRSTSCPNAPYLTSAGWYPVERGEPNDKAILYYRAAGDTSKVHALPEGIQLLAGAEGRSYNCGAEPLDPVPLQPTPPYGCNQGWATHIKFPTCWDGFGLTAEHTVYGVDGSRTNCPASHPHRIIEVNFTIPHPNTDGNVPNPLEVSVGTNQWGPYTSMHADYFYAPQNQVYRNTDLDGDGRIEQYDNDGDGRYEPWDADGDSERNLTDLCVIDAPSTLAYANARCRADGLLNAHVRALHNYYDGRPVPTNQPTTFNNPPSATYPSPA